MELRSLKLDLDFDRSLVRHLHTDKGNLFPFGLVSIQMRIALEKITTLYLQGCRAVAHCIINAFKRRNFTGIKNGTPPFDGHKLHSSRQHELEAFSRTRTRSSR